MARNGIRDEIISRILNHKLPGETNRVCNQYGYDKEKRAGLTKLDSIIRRIVEGRLTTRSWRYTLRSKERRMNMHPPTALP